MQSEIDELTKQNRALKRDIAEYKHKLNVQRTLRNEFNKIDIAYPASF